MLISLQPTRQEVLEAAFAERALAPVITKFGTFALRFTPVGWNTRANKRLVKAAMFPRFDASSWAAVRLVAIFVAVVLWFFLQGSFAGTTWLFVTIFFGVLGFLGPEIIVSRKIDDRQAAIEKDMPDVIDLLVISVEAGLGFEAALGRVVQNVPGELSDEFSRMLQETRVGVSRNEAMKNLAERTDVGESELVHTCHEPGRCVRCLRGPDAEGAGRRDQSSPPHPRPGARLCGSGEDGVPPRALHLPVDLRRSPWAGNDPDL